MVLSEVPDIFASLPTNSFFAIPTPPSTLNEPLVESVASVVLLKVAKPSTSKVLLNVAAPFKFNVASNCTAPLE